MKTIVMSPLADGEYKVFYEWYESRAQGLGDKFKFEVQKMFDLISTFPTMNRERNNGFRYGHCKKMHAYFAYIEETDIIVVHRIWHDAQNPDEWSRKLSSGQ
ncbi:MAG: type II toxin-antitoxin system RelE/ParE family toxin [Planctomycetes bacterium]|nr:type II toxin-antitoxin system RelE/ParE family toxin [Planctomycetota bacterium]